MKKKIHPVFGIAIILMVTGIIFAVMYIQTEPLHLKRLPHIRASGDDCPGCTTSEQMVQAKRPAQHPRSGSPAAPNQPKH